MKRPNRHLIFLLFYGVWIVGILTLLGTSSCTASRSVATPEQQAQLESVLNNRDFSFDVEFAVPTASQAYLSAANVGFAPARGSSPAQINLSGEGYFIKVRGDSVQTNLPYFGVSDNISDFSNTQRGINIEGAIEELKIKSTKTGKEFEFFAREGFERFRFIMSVSPDLKTRVSVFSPQRDLIRFTGKLSKTRGS